MESVLIVIHLLIVVALCGVVLLQRSEGGGLGIGGGSAGPTGFLTGRGQANLLTRTTAMLGIAFFVTSLVLSILAARSRAPQSVLDRAAPTQPAAPGAPAAPTAPAAPAQPGSVLDQLRQGQQPAAPAQPR